MGYKPRCRSRRHRKLKTAFLNLIISLHETGMSYREIARRTDLDRRTISKLGNDIMQFYK